VNDYYRYFNERRVTDAAALFSEDADIEFIPGENLRGPLGYHEFAGTWTSAFPNLILEVESMSWRDERACEIYLRASGTHQDVFRFGRYQFQPTGADVSLRLRELLEVSDGRITSSMIAVDFNEMVRQLTRIDYDELLRLLERMRFLGDELRQSSSEDVRRELASKLGRELDAARRALRPHFSW
jgi:predicted ester cyclase